MYTQSTFAVEHQISIINLYFNVDLTILSDSFFLICEYAKVYHYCINSYYFRVAAGLECDAMWCDFFPAFCAFILFSLFFFSFARVNNNSVNNEFSLYSFDLVFHFWNEWNENGRVHTRTVEVTTKRQYKKE